jgi:hypothetical protein
VGDSVIVGGRTLKLLSDAVLSDGVAGPES